MGGTPFEMIYNRFLGKITDDQYLIWTKEDTEKDLKNILLDAIPNFEFPRFSLYNYDIESEKYCIDLTSEEINILAILMYKTWLQRQIASIENIRMKPYGVDFKMSSQANHLSQLNKLKEKADLDDKHYQRLYKRRKLSEEGKISSNWSCLRDISTFND